MCVLLCVFKYEITMYVVLCALVIFNIKLFLEIIVIVIKYCLNMMYVSSLSVDIARTGTLLGLLSKTNVHNILRIYNKPST